MPLIDQYVQRLVLTATALVASVFVGLDSVLAFLEELKDLENDYQIGQALYYILGTLPRRFYEHIPESSLIGAIIGLGTLAHYSELTILRCAGVSITRITYSVMKPILLLIILTMITGEYIAPYTEQLAQSRRAVAMGGDDINQIGEGHWHRENNEYIYVKAVLPNGELYGVTRHQFNQQGQLQRASFAKKAIYRPKDQQISESYWVMEDIKASEFQPERIIVKQIDTEPWRTKLTPDLLSVVIMKPENLSINGLLTYADYLSRQGLSTERYLLAFWRKCLLPLTTASLVFVAVSFVFGPLRSVSMGFRVFVGVIVAIVFKYMQQLLGPASLVFGFAPLWAILAPMMISIVFGALLIRRAG